MHILTAHRAIGEQPGPSTINVILLNTILQPVFVSVYLFALKPDPVLHYAEKQTGMQTAALDGREMPIPVRLSKLRLLTIILGPETMHFGVLVVLRSC